VITPMVLFLCTANAARSQMAEGLMRVLAADRFEVHSAGTHPTEVDELAVQVMNERGIDISAQRAKSVDEFLGRHHVDYLIALCSEADQECPVFPGAIVRLNWPFDDPALAPGGMEERLEEFRRVRDQIEARIRAWLAETTAPNERRSM
jgi:arsenate reductase (thioredoxin)